jgi:hypothetical protein
VSDAYVCTPCSIDLERALGDVRWLLDQLDIVLTRQTAKSEGGYVTGSSEQPMPYDVRASDAKDALVNLVLTWARLVAEERPATLPMIGGVGITAAWLSSYAGWLRTHAAGADAVSEILAAVNAARRVIDVRPEKLYAGPCTTDGCGHDLYAERTAQAITCPACGERFDVAERRAFLLESARDHLGTVREVVGLFRGTVTVDQLKGWVRRGKVSAHGSTVVNGRTVATYRVGDVMDAENGERFDEREQKATMRAGRG